MVGSQGFEPRCQRPQIYSLLHSPMMLTTQGFCFSIWKGQVESNHRVTEFRARRLTVLAIPLVFGAGNETRTRDIYLGKVVLYQLSYSRIGARCIHRLFVRTDCPFYGLATNHPGCVPGGACYLTVRLRLVLLVFTSCTSEVGYFASVLTKRFLRISPESDLPTLGRARRLWWTPGQDSF